MATRADKVVKFGKLGLIASIIAALCDAAALTVILPKWDFQEMIINLGTKRTPIAQMAIFLAVVLGITGFLMGLEAASHGEGKVRGSGWAAFWIGSISAMVGIILGLLYMGYKF
jgi:hypothetical protein